MEDFDFIERLCFLQAYEGNNWTVWSSSNVLQIYKIRKQFDFWKFVMFIYIWIQALYLYLWLILKISLNIL